MRRFLFVLALAGLPLTACGDDTASSGSVSSAPPEVETPLSADAPAGSAATESTSVTAVTAATASSNATQAAEAPDALQFTAPLVGGGSLDFTQFAGRTVALWFWAPT